MAHSLHIDGDYFERLFYPYLRDTFPNYEILWQEFVTPLTLRSENGGIQLRQKVAPLLEEMCMAHYSVYYHLGFARFNSSHFVDSFEAVFFHMGTATEMVDRFMFSLAKLDYEISPKQNPIAPIDAQKYYTLVKNNWGTKLDKTTISPKSSPYMKAFEKFRSNGRSVNVRLHTIQDVTKDFYLRLENASQKNLDDWYRLVNKLRNYRNTLIHNPLIVRVFNKSMHLPLEGKLYKYGLWSNALYNFDTTEFAPLDEIFRDFHTRIETMVNTLWDPIMLFLRKVSHSDRYRAMSNIKDKPSAEDEKKSGESAPTQPTNPSSVSGDFSFQNISSGVRSPFTGASGLKQD